MNHLSIPAMQEALAGQASTVMDKELIEESIKESTPMTESTKAYPKFQLSKFLDTKRDYQIVIRTDSYEELVAAMESAKTLVKGIEAKTQTSADSGSQESPKLNGFCSLHGVQLQEGHYKTDNQYHKAGEIYWYHRSDDGQNLMCFGRGYKAKQ